MAYANLTIDQLKALLRERGIRGYSGKKKADLIAMLEQREIPVAPVKLAPDTQRIPLILFTEIQMLIDHPEKIRRRYWGGDMQTIIRNAFDNSTLPEALDFVKEELGVDLIEYYNQRKSSTQILGETPHEPYTQSKQIASVYMNLLETNAHDFEEFDRLARYRPEEIGDPIAQSLTRNKFDKVSLPLVIRFLRDKMRLTLPTDVTRQQLADIFIEELQKRANARP